MPEASPLVLEILKAKNETLKMSLFEQQEAAATLRHYSQCDVSFNEVGRLCQEVISVLNKANKKYSSSPDLVLSLKKTGQLLWDYLFTRPVKEKLKNTQTLDLILSIDEELISIPWELLYDGSNFLCLNFNLGRIVRTAEQAAQPQYRSFSSVLKMLILANPTNDLKSAYLEGVNIKNKFDRLRENLLIDFKSTFVDKLYIKRNMRDYDIVHFAGHCEYDPDNPENTGWILSDGRFTTQDILAMGQAVSLPALVFSNACHSAQTHSDLFDQDCQQRNYSLASAFLFSGVRHYIGAICRIEDPLSLDFAREFYTQLISGKTVGECMRLGRLSLVKEYGIAACPWASYILYGDPNFILFKAKAPSLSTPKLKFSLSPKKIRWISLAAVIICLSIYLYMWLPTINPSTYFLFSRSRSLFHQGKNQEVITLASRILEKEPMFLAAYPLLADTYQRVGDKENALRLYFDYARFSEKKQDKKSLASAYIGLGWLYHLDGDFLKAMDFYGKAAGLSSESGDRLNEARVLRKLAVWHTDQGNYDQALELLTKSSEIDRERSFLREHRYNLACDYFDIGLVFANKNDFASAKKFYEKSRVYFEKMKLKNELSDCFFNLGEIYLLQKQYQTALDYYLRGLAIDEARGDKMNLVSDYNMIGELYLDMDDLLQAENFFHRAAEGAKQIHNHAELASAYYNLGLLYKNKGKKTKTREYFRQAQEIYREIDRPKYEKIKNELLSLNN